MIYVWLAHRNFLLKMIAIIEVPTNITIQYNQRLFHIPESSPNPNANEWAGLIH